MYACKATKYNSQIYLIILDAGNKFSQERSRTLERRG